MEFQCGCWRKPLTRSHRPWPCYSTNLHGSAFFRETRNSPILYPFSRKERETVENYRPISLPSVISKVLERCVLAGLRGHISHLISREQHGFFPGRSCVTQLTSVLHYIGGQLDAGKQIGIIYLDMSKAFYKVDRIWHVWRPVEDFFAPPFPCLFTSSFAYTRFLLLQNYFPWIPSKS